MTGRRTATELGIGAALPGDCNGLEDVRQALDTIDREIVALLGMRLGYVREAARFKPDAGAIPAPERVEAMLSDRESWSDAEGLPPDFTVPLFAQIIRWYIRQQTRHWHETQGGTSVSREAGPRT